MIKRYLVILVLLALLAQLSPVGLFQTSGVAAQEPVSASKISSLLALQVQAKLQAVKAGGLAAVSEASPPAGQFDILQLPGIRLEDLSQQQLFIHFTQQPTQSQIAELEAMGITPYPDSWIPPLENHPSGFILADIPTDKLEILAEKGYVVRLETAERVLQPQNDLATQKINADDVWASGYNGTGVRIAVLDSGLDLTHPDIPTPVAKKDYSGYPILDDTIANTVSGHGTHVTGSVLGRGTQSGGVYKGSAPGADLIFLKVGKDDGSLPVAAITNAIRAATDNYSADIIAMSIGGWDAYHDGTSPEAQAVDYAVSRGVVVLIAAGNEADDNKHYSGTVAASSTTGFIQINVAGAGNFDTTLWFNLVWYDGTSTSNNLTMQFYSSNQTPISTFNAPQSQSIRGTESRLGFIGTSSGPYAVPAGNGTYFVKVTNGSTSSQFFHLYEFPASAGSVTFQNADPNYTIASPADADSAIAVGAYTTRKVWYDYANNGWQSTSETVDQISTFSNRGPRVDTGAPPKPNIVAPGTKIISARDNIVYPWANRNAYYIDNDGPNRSNAAGGSNDGNGPADYYLMQGTSMATPIAAGVAALILQKNPGWTPAQVKQALESTATDKGTPGHDNDYGWGLINALAVVQPRIQVDVDTKYWEDGSYQLRITAGALAGDVSSITISGPSYLDTATVNKPGETHSSDNPKQLYDDGQHWDGDANDGRWFVVLNIDAVPTMSDTISFHITYNDSITETRHETINGVFSETAQLVSPPDGSTLDTLTPTFRWVNLSIPVWRYSVQIDDVNYNRIYSVYDLPDGTTSYTIPPEYLRWGTTYYWLVSASDANGNTALTSSDTFVTKLITPPAVTTNTAPSITMTSARLSGNLTSLGTALSANVSFDWGLTDNYTDETTAVSMNITGAFSYVLTDLSANTTYHFRAKAMGDDTSYGSDKVFTTAQFPPLPGTQWHKTFGGTGYDTGYSVQVTADGGYIITGFTDSFGAGGSDVYFIKTDASGNMTWSRTFGGAGDDAAVSVQPMADGGYIIAGYTASYGAGSEDVWLIKTDSNGNISWSKTFGGSSYDIGASVRQTIDGGYIVVGSTASYGAGTEDVWLIKTDSTGNETWNKTFGGSTDDGGYSVQQTADGGYVITGWTRSYAPDSVWGWLADVWLIKTDATGNKQWDRTFGGIGDDRGYSVQPTADGGYIITGTTNSFGAGGSDVYLIKTDASGNITWSRTFGGTGDDWGSLSVLPAADGGYVTAGVTQSFSAGISDVYLIKTDASGNMTWSQTFGGTGGDYGYSVLPTADGGYIIAGETNSFGAGSSDVWLIKVARETMALPGDANGDGKINALDITKVERIMAGLDTPTPGADANQDGSIDALDITKVERLIAGLDGEHFTEFYILPPYPRDIVAGQAATVTVGIVNHERLRTSYRLEIKIQGEHLEDVGPILLNDGDKWEQEVSFIPTNVGDNQKMEFLLFKGGEAEASLLLYLWINVKQ